MSAWLGSFSVMSRACVQRGAQGGRLLGFGQFNLPVVAEAGGALGRMVGAEAQERGHGSATW